MKNIFTLLFLMVLFLKFSVHPAFGQNLRINYDLIYKETPILDFMYEDKIDQEEDGDYNRYNVSPYTLIRITDTLRCKKLVLSPGYYLVKPEKKDGYEFLIFKQNGKVIGVVPIYQKNIINPALVFPEPVKPKKPFFIAIPKKIFIDTPKKIIARPFKGWWEQKRVLVPPKAALESKVVGNGKYYEIRLYVDKYLYKSLFKIENN
jgi:hypothetical protein